MSEQLILGIYLDGHNMIRIVSNVPAGKLPILYVMLDKQKATILEELNNAMTSASSVIL